MARIVVIDDDAGIRDFVAACLRLAGHECHPASNGFDGLNLLRETPFDLVITDLVMKYDGMMTIRVIRWEFPNIGIIAMSGHSKSRLDLAKETGADRVLSKPFNPDELKSVIAEVLAIERKAPRK